MLGMKSKHFIDTIKLIAIAIKVALNPSLTSTAMDAWCHLESKSE
jgi:hypothetical protein